jgi:hypothetical protein
MTEHEDQLHAGVGESPQPVVDQPPAHTALLPLRHHCERREDHRRDRVFEPGDPRPGEQHVPDDSTVLLGQQRQQRRRARIVEQPDDERRDLWPLLGTERRADHAIDRDRI